LAKVLKITRVIMKKVTFDNSKTPGIGGRLPTLWLIARNRAIIAAWLVVML
jgi:hypothetical protein